MGDVEQLLKEDLTREDSTLSVQFAALGLPDPLERHDKY